MDCKEKINKYTINPMRKPYAVDNQIMDVVIID